jgi:hypothetical protein
MQKQGTYIGPEEQFKGRTALLTFQTFGRDNNIVTAQFNEGKQWETHSQLHFEESDWEIEPSLFDDCLTLEEKSMGKIAAIKSIRLRTGYTLVDALHIYNLEQSNDASSS